MIELLKSCKKANDDSWKRIIEHSKQFDKTYKEIMRGLNDEL